MKTYQITFVMQLNDDASHPRKWVPEAICDNLNFELNEDVLSWDYKEVEVDSDI